MGIKGKANRQRIVETADTLFYERGYNQTSFSDIAEGAAVPRGNFYYYFKTKDDILAAVTAHREQSVQQMLADWDAAEATPRGRLKRFVGMLRDRADDISRWGCPIGSLNTELCKVQRPQQAGPAQLLGLFRDWARDQFMALGQSFDSADENALHLLTVGQGVCVLASLYQDHSLIDREARRLDNWLDTLQ